MRLTCPSCGARYDVPAEAIPQAGRDVQCSACGRTWFQAAEPPAEEAEAAFGDWEAVPRVADDDEEADDLLEAQAAPLPPMGMARTTVTPEVAGILRAEAAREAEARASEAGRTRPEPGSRPPPLPEAELPPLERALRRRAAAGPAGPAAGPAAGSGAPAPTEALPPDPVPPDPIPPGAEALALPPEPKPEPAPLAEPSPVRSVRQADGGELDPDAIDSTLRPPGRTTADRYPPVRRRRRRAGFGLGLGAGLLAVALLAALYAIAPRVTAAIPAVSGIVGPYAEAVDRARDWLDARLRPPTE
ncbi:zinc-ribbon domain-containing protein [Rubellimicrobium aerolatum]|uniref:Zinc-ribbon domain-containing protein n=1 Tax=Rubellimicrobium aerolatum TaxID=490979 RepID=A0ABW0SCT1_9RHOB|nr:zinc-ribbon domain-containing protein [Rubellimicrobium aerolatum]MBP1806590.1 putative Zn finger-like uncharacterized protein [Rubellimicrobium aerolatum]